MKPSVKSILLGSACAVAALSFAHSAQAWTLQQAAAPYKGESLKIFRRGSVMGYAGLQLTD
jgi:opacity protein-like surface antigen